MTKKGNKKKDVSVIAFPAVGGASSSGLVETDSKNQGNVVSEKKTPVPGAPAVAPEKMVAASITPMVEVGPAPAMKKSVRLFSIFAAGTSMSAPPSVLPDSLAMADMAARPIEAVKASVDLVMAAGLAMVFIYRFFA